MRVYTANLSYLDQASSTPAACIFTAYREHPAFVFENTYSMSDRFSRTNVKKLKYANNALNLASRTQCIEMQCTYTACD